MHKIENFFDKIYCINLARRKDRFFQAQTEFAKHNIDAEFVEGIDGRLLNIPAMTSNDGALVSKGDIGCTLSHLKVTKLAKEKGLKGYLVFEDDVELADNFNEKLKESLPHVPENWDMIYFGGNHCQKPIKVNDFVSKMIETFTTHAMIIKPTVYDALIELWGKENEKVDVAISFLHKKYNCYVLTPHIAFQRASYSDILQVHTDYQHLRK